MREAAFLKQNSEKWKDYETKPATDPDDVAERFIEITDDLAYSRTFYPGSTTTQFVNEVARTFHQHIYKNKREHIKRFVDFWKTELPLTVRANHRKLLYSFSVFMIAVLIGMLSAKTDEGFVRLILGDSYVNKTLENIRKGEPMAIYGGDDETEMFLMITSNNIKVAFFTFVGGILFSFGSFFFLIQNGIMLGAFQFFFFKYGYLLTSVLTIWIHGTIEISSIIVAGAAGFCMGNSILFPKTFSRLESFKRGSMEGLRMVIGLVPMFIIAGFLESFVTRHSDVSKILSAAIILTSAIFIVWYFVIYPIQLSKPVKNGNTV